MKKVNRIFALFLSLILMFSTPAGAWAAETDSYSTESSGVEEVISALAQEGAIEEDVSNAGNESEESESSGESAQILEQEDSAEDSETTNTESDQSEGKEDTQTQESSGEDETTEASSVETEESLEEVDSDVEEQEEEESIDSLEAETAEEEEELEEGEEEDEEIEDEEEDATSSSVSLTVSGASQRYIVLLLDVSGSMAGDPLSEMKDAAIVFCEAVLEASGENYIAIVTYGSSASTRCSFTDDLDTLTSCIDSISAGGGTGMSKALSSAWSLLSAVEDGDNVSKYVVLFSDGLPNNGGTSSSGQYSSSDYSGYKYANYCYNYASEMKDDGITLYTLGFFHNLSGSTLAFAEEFMSDLATGGCFYEVTDGSELEVSFGDIAEIIVDPLSISVSAEEISSTNDKAVYEVLAEITSNSMLVTMTGIYIILDLADGGTILTDYAEQVQYLDELEPQDSYTFTWQIEIDRSIYADGGSFVFTVATGSDQTSAQTWEGNILLDAVNGESNVPVDVWSFANFSDSACELSDADLATLMNDMTAAEKTAFTKYLKTVGNGGHCYGMSVSILLDLMNVVDLTDFTGTDTVFDASLSSGDAHSIICYYHVTQKTALANSAVASYRSLPVSEQLAILEEKAKEAENGGTPVLLSYGASGWGSHAVMAYGVEEGSFTSSTTGVTYDRRVLIYDCNASSWYRNQTVSENNCLLFNEGTDEWEVPAYAKKGVCSTNSGAYLKRCTNTLYQIDTIDYGTNYYNYIATLAIQNKTTLQLSSGGSTWIVFGNSGEITSDSEEELVWYHDDFDVEEEPGALNIILPEEEEEYTLVTNSGDAEEILIDVMYGDRYIYIDSTAADGVSFSDDGTITLVGNEGTFEICIADDNIADGGFDVYTVTGDTEGDIEITLLDDSICVEGDSLDGITIEAKEDDTEDSITISADVSEVEFGRDDEDDLYCANHTGGTAVVENQTEATCSEEGFYDEVVYCVVCNKEISRQTITLEKTEHSESEAVEENRVEPDCVTAGSYDTVVYCSVCGEEVSRETTIIDALGHTAGDSVTENMTEATCTEDGSYDVVIYCSVCGEEVSRETITLEATGHEEQEAVIENEINATCTAEGSYDLVIYCSVCGEEISRETIAFDADGHEEAESVIENVMKATCTAEGSYDVVVYCSVCGEELSRTSVAIRPIGHKASPAVVQNYRAATCTSNGSYQLVTYCDICHERLGMETVLISALGHSYVNNTCTRCGAVLSTASSGSSSAESSFSSSSSGSADTGTEDTSLSDSGLELFSITEPIPEDLGRLLDVTNIEANAYGAALADTTEELKDAVLTSEERTLLHEGAVIRLYLTVNDCTTSPESIAEEDRILIENAKGSGILALYLDIALYKQIGDGEPEALTQTNAPISVVINIPDSLTAAGTVERTWQVVRVHDGQADVLSGVYDEEAGTFTFETDRFSTYALNYTDTEESVAHGTRVASGATGDSSEFLVWIVLGIGAACGILLLVVRKRRRE